jgi:hypothetical protein
MVLINMECPDFTDKERAFIYSYILYSHWDFGNPYHKCFRLNQKFHRELETMYQSYKVNIFNEFKSQILQYLSLNNPEICNCSQLKLSDYQYLFEENEDSFNFVLK